MPQLVLPNYNFIHMDALVELDDANVRLIGQIKDKLEGSGQNLGCHLEGLLYADYLTYWDYTQLDILLNIQKPRTRLPDESIFITYHQITELYFKLIIDELRQLVQEEEGMFESAPQRIGRVNCFLENLVFSFGIMEKCLDHGQFLLFRTALAPASGFQYVQYRGIELYCTELIHLTAARFREEPLADIGIEAVYDRLYWKDGAKDVQSGRKDLSLLNFEKKYDGYLLGLSRELAGRNIFARLSRPGFLVEESMRHELRRLDRLLNVEWRLAHFRSASRHLQLRNVALRPTGGTNWRQYLPPRFQQIIFFPTLWSQEEQDRWGVPD